MNGEASEGVELVARSDIVGDVTSQSRGELTMASTDLVQLAKAAKTAFETSQLLESEERIKALNFIKDGLESRKSEILEANRRDMEASSHFNLSIERSF